MRRTESIWLSRLAQRGPFVRVAVCVCHASRFVENIDDLLCLLLRHAPPGPDRETTDFGGTLAWMAKPAQLRIRSQEDAIRTPRFMELLGIRVLPHITDTHNWRAKTRRRSQCKVSVAQELGSGGA